MSRLLTALAAALLTALAAAAETLTLRQAEAAAQQNNPAVAASAARLRAAEAGVTEARAARLPRLDLSQSVVRSDNPVFVFGSLLEQGRFAPRHFDPAFLNDPDPLTNRRFALNLRYTLFDRFQRAHATRGAGQRLAQVSFAGEETRQQIRLETITRFYAVTLAARRLEVATEARRSAEADAEAIRARVEQGLLVESDLLAAEVHVAGLQQRVLEAEGELAVVRAALATVLGRTPGEAVEVAAAIPQSIGPDLPLDDALARGYAARNQLRIAAAATETAAVQLASVRDARLPRVDTFATWGASNGNADRTLGVAVAVDLFDPGRRARLTQARATVDAARAEEAAARDRATMEIVSAWHRARVARERVAVAAHSVERAEAAARIVSERYEHGLTTITEQLRAHTALVTARLELLAARYDAVVGHAELLRAIGGLTDVEAFT